MWFMIFALGFGSWFPEAHKDSRVVILNTGERIVVCNGCFRPTHFPRIR